MEEGGREGGGERERGREREREKEREREREREISERAAGKEKLSRVRANMAAENKCKKQEHAL